MPFNFKQAYKAEYAPKKTPTLITVPQAQYLALRGHGDPNQVGGDYQSGVPLLYALAYTIKMSKKGAEPLPGYVDFVVPPLEGFWWQGTLAGVDLARKADFDFISVLRMPDFVDAGILAWAKAQVAAKKDLDASRVELLTYDEGVCVQCGHFGPFATESETVAAMASYAEAAGYAVALSATRHHHEIYLSDPRRVAPEQFKTILRHPVRLK